jgi:hypothetical protein
MLTPPIVMGLSCMGNARKPYDDKVKQRRFFKTSMPFDGFDAMKPAHCKTFTQRFLFEK